MTKVMTEFKYLDKQKFETLFDMSTGYVLDFSNRTFREYIADSIGIDIDDNKYDKETNSKANRLRKFWEIESNNNVVRVLEALLEYYHHNIIVGSFTSNKNDERLYEECLAIIEKLKSNTSVVNESVIQANTDDKSFINLAQIVRKHIADNEFIEGLDRLHTFMVMYSRSLCDKHKVGYIKETTLNSLFGGYIKKIKSENLIESKMTENILKMNISILDAFNGLRNNQSFAHANEVLNHKESLLIFGNVCNLVRFIEDLEKDIDAKKTIAEKNDFTDDLPF